MSVLESVNELAATSLVPDTNPQCVNLGLDGARRTHPEVLPRNIEEVLTTQKFAKTLVCP